VPQYQAQCQRRTDNVSLRCELQTVLNAAPVAWSSSPRTGEEVGCFMTFRLSSDAVQRLNVTVAKKILVVYSICTYICIHVHPYIYEFIYIYIYKYIYTCIRIYTNIY